MACFIVYSIQTSQSGKTKKKMILLQLLSQRKPKKLILSYSCYFIIPCLIFSFPHFTTVVSDCLTCPCCFFFILNSMLLCFLVQLFLCFTIFLLLHSVTSFICCFCIAAAVIFPLPWCDINSIFTIMHFATNKILCNFMWAKIKILLMYYPVVKSVVPSRILITAQFLPQDSTMNSAYKISTWMQNKLWDGIECIAKLNICSLC